MPIFKLLQYSGHEDIEYLESWIDMDKVDGFMIPVDPTTGDQDFEVVNIFFNGEPMTVKNEKKLEVYLMDRFVKPSK